jgi:hypothetical protein
VIVQLARSRYIWFFLHIFRRFSKRIWLKLWEYKGSACRMKTEKEVEDKWGWWRVKMWKSFESLYGVDNWNKCTKRYKLMIDIFRTSVLEVIQLVIRWAVWVHGWGKLGKEDWSERNQRCKRPQSIRNTGHINIGDAKKVSDQWGIKGCCAMGCNHQWPRAVVRMTLDTHNNK